MTSPRLHYSTVNVVKAMQAMIANMELDDPRLPVVALVFAAACRGHLTGFEVEHIKSIWEEWKIERPDVRRVLQISRWEDLGCEGNA